jgi:hydrogenase maturation protease
MPSILIIGYGNAIRGDDAIGWRAACELAEDAFPEAVAVLPAAQLAPEMAPEVAEADVVIFVDAACEGSPGEIRRRSLAPQPIPLGEMPHALKPADLIGLTRQLYDASPRCHLITLTGQNFEFQEGLSPVVAAAFPALLERVRDLVGQEL